MADYSSLRQHALLARRNLSEQQRTEHSTTICQRIIQSNTYQNTSTLAVYWAMRDEVDLSHIIQHALVHGKTVALPVIKNKSMTFVEYNQHTTMQNNAFGIPEPALKNTPAQTIRMEKLDLCIMPLVAFDAQLNRIGMGGGFYDRYFAHAKQENTPHRMGVAFSVQQVSNFAPETWDIPMHSLVTEQEIFHADSLK